jgi:hypothetical protein
MLMSFLEVFYRLPGTVKNFLTPNSKKRTREQATENIEVESLPNSKRHATTRFVEEPPKQGELPLQSHALRTTNINHTTKSTIPLALPTTTFTWGNFAPHSTPRFKNNNRYRSFAMQQKSLLAPKVDEDAKGLEIYKTGVEAQRILEDQKYQRAFEQPPRAFSKPYAATTGAAAVSADGLVSQVAAQKPQQVDKYREILSRYTNEVRSTFTSQGLSSFLITENLRHDGGDSGGDAARETGVQLANEKYNQRLEALKSQLDKVIKVVGESKMSLEKEKKTELELKEVRTRDLVDSGFFFYFDLIGIYSI